jgi:hypothetical protein
MITKDINSNVSIQIKPTTQMYQIELLFVIEHHKLKTKTLYII